MSRKVFLQVLVLVLLLLSSLGIPPWARAGGVCGGTYIVEQGETVESIAAKCGTTASIIYTANPGISASLYAGQVLTVPGTNYNGQSSIIVDYSNYTGNSYPYTYINNYNNFNYYAPVSYTGTYMVQPGDTFSGIASRYGVSVSDLWAANPYIWNVNYLYTGQWIYVPAGPAVYMPSSVSAVIVSTPTEPPPSLSFGSAPAGTPKGKIQLSNKANGDVYVSLQGTTNDGTSVINEYPVSGSMQVKVPAGRYFYVAWVGGQKFEGSFNLGSETDRSITFYSNRVVVE